MAIQLRSDIGSNQFLVTGMIRGLASDLQFARISAEDKLDDMQEKAKARIESGESELGHPESTGLTDAQQIFAEALLEQLGFIEDLFVDLRTFRGQSNDNPTFKLLNRTDIEVRRSLQASAEPKAAAAANERKAGTVYALGDIEARRKAIATRRK